MLGRIHAIKSTKTGQGGRNGGQLLTPFQSRTSSLDALACDARKGRFAGHVRYSAHHVHYHYHIIESRDGSLSSSRLLGDQREFSSCKFARPAGTDEGMLDERCRAENECYEFDQKAVSFKYTGSSYQHTYSIYVELLFLRSH